jgi:hypothetical protein
MVKAKEGEIISPLFTAVLSARISRHLITSRLFPGLARNISFTERELQVMEQALRLATKVLQEGRA